MEMHVEVSSIRNGDEHKVQDIRHGEPVPSGSNILLLLPPFYTPYTPPLGISVLKSYLEQHGYHVKCFDFNTIPDIWVAHHKYFELLQHLEGLSVQHGYTNLWYILQAHMMAHLNGAGPGDCAALLNEILTVYELKPKAEVVNGLVPIVTRLFRDIERIITTEVDLKSFAVVGTSTYSTSLGPSLYILKRVKELYPDRMTVMGGGVFADDLADGSDNLAALLEEFTFVDHIVMGEGEVLFHDLLNGKLRGERLLMRERVGSTALNPAELRIPDYTDFHLPDYLHLCIEGARSCPFQCSFCSETVQWGGYRKKPAGILAQQMIELATHYENKTFFMGDSLMNPYIEDLSTSLLRQGAPVLYDGYLRADKIATDKQKVARWARSGCVRTRLGIESASEKVLKAMQKQTTPAGISKAIKTLANAGIRVTTLWIVGFPGETEEDFQETIDFIREHHRYIYELDVHYYYYYPYGQVWSRIHRCYPLYSERVRKAIKFQQWEIVNSDPPRAVKFDRLRRINDLATELGIPNLHTLQARYEAEARWQALYPLAKEFFEGTQITRKPFSVGQHERTVTVPAPAVARYDAQSGVMYGVRVSKRLDQEILRQATEALILYNDILQYDVIDGGIRVASLPEGALSRIVNYAEQAVEPDLAALNEVARPACREMKPIAGESLQVTAINGPDSACVALAIHPAIADSRTAILLLEDLVRVYEQLANGHKVTFRPREITYRDYLFSRSAVWEEQSNTLASDSRPDSSNRIETVALQADLVKSFTPKLLKSIGVSFTELLFGGVVRALSLTGGETVDCCADLRMLQPNLADTCGPLHATYTVSLPEAGSNIVDDLRNLKKELHEAFALRRRKAGAAVSITLEYATAEPWTGSDDWKPEGFMVEDDLPHSGAIAVRLLMKGNQVWATVRCAPNAASRIEEWRKAEESGTDTIWQKILNQASQQSAASSAPAASPSAARRFERRRVPLQVDRNLVHFGTPEGTDYRLPLVVQPATPDLDAFEWASSNRTQMNNLLEVHGALLFRGFGLANQDDFRRFAGCFTDEMLEFSERAAPRIEVAQRVYTSTEYPPEYPIPMHHENAFSYKWPMKVFFFCQTPAQQGGLTPLADDQDFLKALDPVVREIFREKKIMYVRNYGGGVDLPWQEVFGTNNPAEVEEYCRAANTQWEWLSRDRLRTTRIAPAIIKHPSKGTEIWFNHAHLFHASNLESNLRESLLAELGEEGLPRNTYFGDGTPIESRMLDHIRETYDKVAIRLPWQQGDVVFVDNMAIAHGRDSFAGARKILVIMAESSVNSQAQQAMVVGQH